MTQYHSIHLSSWTLFLVCFRVCLGQGKGIRHLDFIQYGGSCLNKHHLIPLISFHSNKCFYLCVLISWRNKYKSFPPHLILINVNNFPHQYRNSKFNKWTIILRRKKGLSSFAPFKKCEVKFPLFHVLDLNVCCSLPYSDESVYLASTSVLLTHNFPFLWAFQKMLVIFHYDVVPIYRRKQKIKYRPTICMHLLIALKDICWSYLLWSY